MFLIVCPLCQAQFLATEAWGGALLQCPNCYRNLALYWTYRTAPPEQYEQPRIPENSGVGDFLVGLLRFGAVVAAAAVVWKAGQAIFDEDFDSVEFPRWFREEKCEEHWASYGGWCPRCGRRVRYQDLTLDHKVALKNGGRTSRANAEVICRFCNSSKGARNDLFDYLRGRSY